MHPLRRMQALLAGLYDAPVEHDVGDFVVWDRKRVDAMLGQRGRRDSDEQVYVVEDEQGVRLGVYIDERVLQRIERRDPTHRLDDENLEDYCTALEGVSHFHYLVWSLSRGRPVSLLELELQAEVDKYVLGAWLLREQGAGRFPRELHRALFERTRIDADAAGERADLYQLASTYAGRFCRRVAARLADGTRGATRELLCELRRFYRWGNARKLRFIEQQA